MAHPVDHVHRIAPKGEKHARKGSSETDVPSFVSLNNAGSVPAAGERQPLAIASSPAVR